MATLETLQQYASKNIGDVLDITNFDFATEDLNRNLRIVQMEKKVKLDVLDGVVALPDDFLEIVQLCHVGNSVRVLAPVIIADDGMKNGTDPASPQFYRLFANSLDIYPKPQDGGGYELSYYGKLAPLTESSSENVALQAGLSDAYVFLAMANQLAARRDMGAEQQYMQKAERIIADANRRSKRARTSGGAVRFRPTSGKLVV